MTLPIDSALLPADVRSGGPEARKLYASALAFEKVLTTELSKSLTAAMGKTDGDGGDEDDGGLGSGHQLSEQLPAQFASALEQGGGLGLAPALYRAMVAREGTR